LLVKEFGGNIIELSASSWINFNEE
jgi:hypothetical protein